MSSNVVCDHNVTSSSNARANGGNNVNAGIDSSFTNNSTNRGSLTPPELDSIHKTNSFKQALQLHEEDNIELAAKTKQIQQTK